MGDRLANDDVRQRRALQKLQERVAELESLVESLQEAGTPVDAETPAGTINGTNDTFTLTFTPVGQSLQLFRNGVLLRAGAGNDYQLSANTITFNAGEQPDTGAALIAFYRK